MQVFLVSWNLFVRHKFDPQEHRATGEFQQNQQPQSWALHTGKKPCRNLSSSASPAYQSSPWPLQPANLAIRAVEFRPTHNAQQAVLSRVRLLLKHLTKISRLAQLLAVPQAHCAMILVSANGHTKSDCNNPDWRGDHPCRVQRKRRGYLICPRHLFWQPFLARLHWRDVRKIFNRPISIARRLARLGLRQSLQSPIGRKAISTRQQQLVPLLAPFATTSDSANSIASASRLIPRKSDISTVRNLMVAGGFSMFQGVE